MPGTRILEVARLVDARCIVVGSSSRGRVAKLMQGSLSSWVANHSERAVRFVHAGENPQGYEKVSGDRPSVAPAAH